MDGLEGNSRGFIDEGFLTSELEDGLNQINRMVTDLSDILDLPRMQDHQFQEGIQQAKQSANQTVDKLRQFDHQQTQSFTALIEDVSLLQNYIEEMSQQFASGKMKLTNFSPVMLQDLEAYGKLQTKLYNQTVMQRWNSEHFPELGVFYPIGHAASFDQWVNPSCARPEPKKKTAGEAFWDFTNGFGAGIINAASDTWDGIKRLATEPDQVLKETIEFLDAVISDLAILLEIGHELYNSFNESVIHGDATSRGEWLGYATAIIGTSVVGDKGLSKVGGVAGKLGTKVETDINIKLKEQQEKVMSSVKGSSAAGLERVRELMGGKLPNNQWGMTFAGVPSNVMNSVGIFDKVNKLNKNIVTKIEVVAGKSPSTKTYKLLKEHKNNKYFTRSVEFNAGIGGTGFTYKVYQRGDINWDMIRTKGAKKGRGLTNAEASAKYGLAPILDDAGSVATLHHSQQKGIGPLYEASTRYHNISNAKRAPLHPYKGKLNPFYPMDESTRTAFQKVDSIDYWKTRGQEALGGDRYE